jgi:SPP1 gp7 family putative phage head morphogenesis protein
LSKRIAEVYQKAKDYRTDRIARTETATAANQGTLEAYKQSGVVKKKEWITADDERLCDLCAPMDGEVVNIDDNFSAGISAPPLHPNCRCTIVAAFEQGKPEISNTREAVLTEFNEKYATAKKEYSLFVDKDGNKLLEKLGTKTHINYTKEELDRLLNIDDLIMIHNHPSGSSFSGDDLKFLFNFKKGTEIRAVGKEYLYISKLTKDTPLINDYGQHVRTLVRSARNSKMSLLQSKYQKIYNEKVRPLYKLDLSAKELQKAKRKIALEVSVQQTHEAVELLAKDYKIYYKRVKR